MSTKITTIHDDLQLKLPNYNQFIIGKWVAKNNTEEVLVFDHRTSMESNIEKIDIQTDKTSATLAAKAYGSEFLVGFVLTKNDPFFIIEIDISNESIEPNINDSRYLKTLFPDSLTWLSANNSRLFIMGISHGLEKKENQQIGNVKLILDNYVVGIGNMKNSQGSALTDSTKTLDSLLNSDFFPNTAYSEPSIIETTSEKNEVSKSTTVDPIFEEYEGISTEQISDLNGDHLRDAAKIMDITFNKKLARLGEQLHFFNGKELDPLNDRFVRRHIGLAMKNGGVKVSQNRISGTLSILKDQVPFLGKPDPVSLKVFFSNGVFNLVSDEFEEHCISNKNTRTLSVDYSMDYQCVEFIKWLKDIFKNEPERIEYLQEMIGWSLCRDNLGIEKGMMFLGPTRAGKGVILRLMRFLHGRGAVSLELSELDDNKRLSAMKSSHIAIDTDAVGPTKKNEKVVTTLFKIITSNEPIGVKLLWVQTPDDGPLDCKICISVNSAPIMSDHSAATANRWLPLVFDRSFLGKEDPALFSKLKKEAAGIANWALEGLRRLVLRKHFVLPLSSLSQIDQLISDNGNVHDFISEGLILDKDERCSNADLWDCYEKWALAGGHEQTKKILFLKSIEDALRGRGARRSKSIKMDDGSSKRGFYGIKLIKPITTNNTSPSSLPKSGELMAVP